MPFKRVLVSGSTDVPERSRAGMGLVGAQLTPVAIATDTALTLTVAQIASGLVVFTGFSAGRAVTVPTAANILAANPGMDIGDSFTILFAVTVAFAATWTANTGVTLAGRATLPASTVLQAVVVTRTGAATFTWFAS